MSREDNRPASSAIRTVRLSRTLSPAFSRAIQEAVARHYAISIDALVGERRTKRIVVPRQVAMYLCRELTDSSLPAIGRAFGGRDHTTVLYAVQKISGLLTDGGDVYESVQALTQSLAGSPR